MLLNKDNRYQLNRRYTFANSSKRKNMKTFILAAVLTISALQAEGVVHYDKKDAKASSISKPNYPSTDLYTK